MRAPQSSNVTFYTVFRFSKKKTFSLNLWKNHMQEVPSNNPWVKEVEGYAVNIQPLNYFNETMFLDSNKVNMCLESTNLQ